MAENTCHNADAFAYRHWQPRPGAPLPADYAFFRAHAGGWVGHNAASALRLARAERWLEERDDLSFDVFGEDDPDLSFMSERERAEPHEVICVAIIRKSICDHGKEHVEWLTSLGNVVDADRDYMRVLRAELALEVMPDA